MIALPASTRSAACTRHGIGATAPITIRADFTTEPAITRFTDAAASGQSCDCLKRTSYACALLSRRRQDDVRHDLVRLQHGFAVEILVRHLEELAGIDLARAVRSDDAEASAVGDHRHREARRMNDVAGAIAEDRVELVLAFHREAARAALLQAVELFVAEVPAARPLHDVAADRAHVADLRRADAFGRRDERGKQLSRRRMLGKIDDLRRRADAQSAIRRRDRLIEALDR